MINADKATIANSLFYKPGKSRCIILHWSKDWFSLHPWTAYGERIPYFTRSVLKRDLGTMTSWFFGPLVLTTFVRHVKKSV